MAPIALLLLAACALAAPLHAASIPNEGELQKKIPAVISEETKEPAENNLVHESVEQLENIKETQELRAKPAEDIPVEVVVENIEPSIKINDVLEDVEINRPKLDLRNPGPPQRQEHETQNPEQHPDQQLKFSTLKDNIEQAQTLLRQSFQDVSSGIQNWVSNSIDQSKIQQNIQSLRETFTNQIQKLNDTIQAYGNPEQSKPTESQGEESESDFRKIESRLKLLEDNFYNGVETLSAGVRMVANLKSADAGDASREDTVAPPAALPAVPAAPVEQALPASTTPPPNVIVQFFNQAISTLSNRTTTMLGNIQDMLSPQSSTPPAGAQADEPSSTPATGFGSLPIFSGWNRPNITFGSLFPGTGSNSNPFANFNFGGLFANIPLLGSTTAKPAEEAATTQATVDKPEKPEAQADKPAVATVASPANPQPAAQPTAQNTGPIREFLSPVIQGITNTAQRIQNIIVPPPPERVRDVEKTDSTSSSKGGNGRPGSGDSDDSSGLSEQQAEEIKEPIQEEPKKAEPEVKPEISDKTD